MITPTSDMNKRIVLLAQIRVNNQLSNKNICLRWSANKADLHAVAFGNTHWTYDGSRQSAQAAHTVAVLAAVNTTRRFLAGDTNLYQVYPAVAPATRVLNGDVVLSPVSRLAGAGR